MPDHEYNIDMRDIRFNLFEYLPFDRLSKIERYAEVDRESIEHVLDESFRFNREAIAPSNAPGDRTGCVFENGVVRVPEGTKEAYRAFCDNGWIGVSSSPDLGGMGLPNLVGVATAEMYIGANCSMALNPGLTRAAASLLEAHATEEMKALYLPKMLSGEWQGTMCLTEPQAGSAVGDVKTMAKPEGESWLITGNKIFITAGDHDMCENHVHLVLARTPDAPKGFKGISLFLVPKYLPNADGSVGDFNDVVCAGIEHKLGIRGSPTCSLNFGDDGKCRGWLIGEVGRGLFQMFHMMNEARIGVGIQSLALASQAYLYALEYAKERVQGVDIEQMKNLDAPRVTISEHPDIKRMLLWSKAIVEGSRALLYKAAFFADLHQFSEDKEEAEQSRRILEILTPICKAWISDRSFEVATQAIQIMGGYGYVSEYPVEQHLRDVKIASIYEGTNGIQALDLLGRKLTQEGGLLYTNLVEKLQGFVSAQKSHFGLSDEMKVFAEEVERWNKVTMNLGMMGMQGDQKYPVLSATPYLELTGNVVVAWVMLEQAILLHDKLQSRYIAKEAMDEEARAVLHEDDPESRFFFNKLEAVRYFVHAILRRNVGIAAQIDSNDRSALRFLP